MLRVTVDGKKAMAEVKRKMEKETLRQLVRRTETMVDALVPATPVDTGAARKSWGYRIDGNHTVITNDVPYIQELNRGSSKQAPSFFVEMTLLRFGRPFGRVVETTPP